MNQCDRYPLEKFVLVSIFCASIALSSGGCRSESLTIVTNWPQEDCQVLETEFRNSQFADSISPHSIRWILLDPWLVPQDSVALADEVDIFLGWTARELAEVSNFSLQSDQVVLIRSKTGHVQDSKGKAGESPSIFDSSSETRFLRLDPRVNLRVSHQIGAFLSMGDWQDRYATLVSNATSGTFLIDFKNLESQISTRKTLQELAVARSEDPLTITFLDYLKSTLSQSIAQGQVNQTVLESSDLLYWESELISATIIDCWTELQQVGDKLSKRMETEGRVNPLFEAPPWPPASVQLMKNHQRRRQHLPTLTQLFGLDEENRDILVESWEWPAQSIDRALLTKLINLGDGRIFRNEALRTWLRAEWHAWARQRYKALTRSLEGELPAR